MLRPCSPLPSAWHLQVTATTELALRPKLPRFKSFEHFLGEMIDASVKFTRRQIRDVRRIHAADEKGCALAIEIFHDDHPSERAEFLALRARRYYRLLRGNGNPWRDD